MFPAMDSNPVVVKALAIPPVFRFLTCCVVRGTCRSADRSRLARRTSFIRGAILPDKIMESESGADNDSPLGVAEACPSTAAVVVDVPPWPWLIFRGLSWEGHVARKGSNTKGVASHFLRLGSTTTAVTDGEAILLYGTSLYEKLLLLNYAETLHKNV